MKRRFGSMMEMASGGLVKHVLELTAEVETITTTLNDPASALSPEREVVLREDRGRLLDIIGKYTDKVTNAFHVQQKVIALREAKEGGNRGAKPGFAPLVAVSGKHCHHPRKARLTFWMRRWPWRTARRLNLAGRRRPRAASPPRLGSGRPISTRRSSRFSMTRRRTSWAMARKARAKSVGFGHKIVRHAYENDNALVLIIAPSMRTGNEGIWHDLETLILPQWKEGMDLEYTQAKLDPNTKDRHRWVRNRFGGWSKLLLMAIPYATQVQARIKGPAPSMVYVDELTNCNGLEYFTYPAAQLGRRRGIVGPQQFCASCNPEGPSHWVYKAFLYRLPG